MLLPLLFGAIVGTTLGLFGGGGSTLAIPLLAYGIGLPAREAIATSLVAVTVAALAGAFRNWRHGTLDLKIALTFGVVGAFGGAIGAQLARAISPSVQMVLFAVVIIVAAFLMLGQIGVSRNQTEPSRTAVFLAALGPGVLTGLAGIGAGFAVVPALVSIAGMPMHRAIGTSLLVIAFNAGGGIASYASYVALDPAILVPFSGAAVFSVLLAANLGARIEEHRLRVAFSVLLILVGALTIGWEVLGGP